MNTDQFAVVTSILTLGGLIGALFAGPFCSKHGRLRAMRLMTLPFITGATIECLAPNIPLLAFGRFLSGLGAGASIVVVPIYISETAPPDQRALFGAFTQIMTNFGILVTQTLGLFLSRGNWWRLILAAPAAISIFLFLALGLVPESPKWLAEHGQVQKAREILHKIRGRHFDAEEMKSWDIRSDSCMPSIGLSDLADSDSAEQESLIESSQKKDTTSSVGIFAAMRSSLHRPAVIAVIGIMLAQQLTGINSIVMYSVDMLKDLLPTSAAILTVAVSALNLVMTTLCAPLADKLGRKTCLLLSTAGMGLSSILLGAGLATGTQVMGAIAVLLVVASFAFGLGPVPFILPSELAKTEAVGATQSWALVSNWTATFIVSQFFPIVNHALAEQGRVYFIFAGLALILGLFIAVYVPEPLGKRDADEVWGRRESRDRVE